MRGSTQPSEGQKELFKPKPLLSQRIRMLADEAWEEGDKLASESLHEVARMVENS